MTTESRNARLLKRAIRKGIDPRLLLGNAVYDKYLNLGYIQNGINGKKITTGLTGRGKDFILFNKLV